MKEAKVCPRAGKGAMRSCPSSQHGNLRRHALLHQPYTLKRTLGGPKLRQTQIIILHPSLWLFGVVVVLSAPILLLFLILGPSIADDKLLACFAPFFGVPKADVRFVTIEDIHETVSSAYYLLLFAASWLSWRGF